jgi:hypothetical protein
MNKHNGTARRIVMTLLPTRSDNRMWMVLSLLIVLCASREALAQTDATTQHPARKASALEPAAGSTTPVTGSGTAGQLTKWASANTLGDSSISEDKSGNVGIGTTGPASRLTVVGVIESTSGGVKFPDGTVQTTAVNKTSSPALQPFARSLTVQFPPGGGPAEAMFTVPAGKQLVIETVSLEISLVPSQANFVPLTLSSTVGGEVVNYRLFANKVLDFSSLVNLYAFTQPLKFYADPDTQVIATLKRENSVQTGGFSLYLSGYLVDVP